MDTAIITPEVHPCARVALDNSAAAIVLMPCPGTKGPSMEKSLEQLVEQGVQGVITLMTPEELTRNGVDGLPSACQNAGIRWFHVPIEDDQLPDEQAISQWRSVSPAFHELLADGKSVAIHCKGGAGRTGLAAAMILLERGWAQERVVAEIRAVQPKSLNKPHHCCFVDGYAQDVDTQRSASH